MKIFPKVILALTLVSSLAAQQPAKDTADQPTKDQSAKKDILAGREGMTENFFKLAFVMYELEDGKRTNQRDYMMIGRTDNQPSIIRVATKVPITTLEKGDEKQYTYTDVGLRINCSMKEQVDRRLQVHCDIEISSFIRPEQIANATGNAGLAAPFLRTTRIDSWELLTPGKPALLTSVDDINSTKRLQVEVTATKIE
jgi:hypothetical protein